jgi:hypothetical protein
MKVDNVLPSPLRSLSFPQGQICQTDPPDLAVFLIPHQQALLVTNVNEISFQSTSFVARGSFILPAYAKPCHNFLVFLSLFLPNVLAVPSKINKFQHLIRGQITADDTARKRSS